MCTRTIGKVETDIRKDNKSYGKAEDVIRNANVSSILRD